MKLWDTNILGELTRRTPHPGLQAWVRTQDELAISVVTVEEIWFGLRWKPRIRVQAWLETFIQERCEVLDVTEPVARLAGQLRGRLRTGGKVRTQADLLIAATSRIHEIPLVTRNVRDFEGCGIEILNPFS